MLLMLRQKGVQMNIRVHLVKFVIEQDDDIFDHLEQLSTAQRFDSCHVITTFFPQCIQVDREKYFKSSVGGSNFPFFEF